MIGSDLIITCGQWSMTRCVVLKKNFLCHKNFNCMIKNLSVWKIFTWWFNNRNKNFWVTKFFMQIIFFTSNKGACEGKYLDLREQIFCWGASLIMYKNFLPFTWARQWNKIFKKNKKNILRITTFQFVTQMFFEKFFSILLSTSTEHVAEKNFMWLPKDNILF